MKQRIGLCILFPTNMDLMMNSTFTRFISAGLVNTLVGYIVFLLSYNLVGLEPTISNVISYLAGICCAYYLNKYFVFSNNSKKDQSYVFKFLICFAVAYSVNLISLKYFMEYMNANYAQIIAMSIYTIVFYIFNKFIVFRG